MYNYIVDDITPSYVDSHFKHIFSKEHLGNEQMCDKYSI